MSKPNTPLRLAKSSNQWREIDGIVENCVAKLVGAYDDPNQVRAFLQLMDLMTNPDYDVMDRQMVTFRAAREAFHYAPECADAQEAYMASLALPAEQRKSA